MKTLATGFSSELRGLVLPLLWRQWSALGVAGQTTSGGQALIDPEALLLASTTFARHDARLFDEMLDWLRSNGTWINVQRLGHLQREFDLGDRKVLGAVAEYLAQDSSHLKWKTFAKWDGPAVEAEPLFPHLAVFNRTDEVFRRWGWLRAPIERRGLSRAPRPDQPATFLLKLRALFGRQSRAEVLAWLLTHDSGHPAEIARQTGYFRGSVQSVLNELELSGHVYATRNGREKHFAIRSEPWRFLLTWDSSPAAAFPRWLPWPTLFGLLRGVHELMGQDGFLGGSPELQSIELNRVLGPFVARLASEGYASAMPIEPGTGTVAQTMQGVRRLIAEIGG